jgi:predicted nucleic acid-binding protein
MGKKQVVCDTDVLIDYFDISNLRHSKCCEILENQIGLDNIILSAITFLEIQSGARNKSEQNKIRKKLARFNMALLSAEITTQAIDLFEKYRLSHGLAIPDCLISSKAVVLDVELFTFNVKDYRFIDSVKLYEIGIK